jgi:hypothetical protein
MQKKIYLLLMIIFSCCAAAQQARHERRFNYTAKGCEPDSLKKKAATRYLYYNKWPLPLPGAAIFL